MAGFSSSDGGKGNGKVVGAMEVMVAVGGNDRGDSKVVVEGYHEPRSATENN
ncbi:hypothetical protein ES332_D09G090600v1 [Gossypium tomentosum]|uniref:Uncharacterized protein n=1 Tax=Gossypium tomentosum TaxID=34277 RepID=A0A5D2JH01_GOSTO|nr:hypothetical protein ES332_D09G090600v1 [Gossypium tomentosum]